jgi:alpha-tubulin suppressor-like RCC1 family protein
MNAVGSVSVALAIGAVAGCSERASSGVMLALSAEPRAPEEMDRLVVEVFRGGQPKLSQEYALPGPLPGTLGVHDEDGEADGPPVAVRISGGLGADAGSTVTREVRFRLRQGRTKLLRIRLQSACIGVKCDAEETCIDGACAAIDVDADTLPDFSGTAEALDPPGCFDPERCLSDLVPVEVDASCSFAAPAAPFNVAMTFAAAPDRAEVLEPGGAYTSGDRVVLSRELCDALRAGRARAVFVSTACPPKTTPVCASLPPRPGGGGGAAGGGAGGSGGSALAGGGGMGAAGSGGVAGGAGSGGLAGSAGTGGLAGSAGTGGLAGSAGSGGLGGVSGSSASGGSGGASGSSGGAPVALPGELSVGSSRACAVRAGQVFCWGHNTDGSLLPGGPRSLDHATLVPGITTAVAVSVGYRHACALLGDGTVACWGNNDAGGVGVAAPGIQAPGIVTGVSGATQVLATLEDASCAVLETGTVTCWGYGLDGSLGDGSTANRSTPMPVPGLSGVSRIHGSHPICAVAEGNMTCWGADVLAPSELLGTGDVVEAVAGGEPHHAFARRADGSVVMFAQEVPPAWAGPTDVPVPPGTVTQMDATGDYLCLRYQDASVQCSYIGNTVGFGAFAPVDLGGRPADDVRTGFFFRCVVFAGGEVGCWGTNADGELGDDRSYARRTPVPFPGLTGAERVFAGTRSTVWKWTDGTAGNHQFVASGQTRAFTLTATSPTALPMLTGDVSSIRQGKEESNESAYVLTPGAPLRLFFLGGETVGRLQGAVGMSDAYYGADVDLGLSNGSVTVHVATADADFYGLVGDGTGPTTVGETKTLAGPANVVSLAATVPLYGQTPGHACALTAGGSIHCWGVSSQGETGTGMETTVTAPTPVAFADPVPTVAAVATGYRFGCAISVPAEGGEAYCWGLNTWGVLGLDPATTQHSALPSKIAGVSGAIGIVTGDGHACVWTAAGDVTCWGRNVDGELGRGTVSTYETAPMPVGIQGAMELATGGPHTCARLSDGTGACWGSNYWGAIGSGISGTVTSPTTVIGLPTK